MHAIKRRQDSSTTTSCVTFCWPILKRIYQIMLESCHVQLPFTAVTYMYFYVFGGIPAKYPASEYV